MSAPVVKMADPTAQTEPLTIGQKIVAGYETDLISEPCDAQAIDDAVADERKWFECELRAIKGELNGMALIGVKPMWGSLISRLEQLIADAKARHP